jgi:hypothetical protein
MADPKSLDPTNVPRPVMLIARPESDGTLTLILDCPGSDTFPIEIGSFRELDQMKQAVVDSLTAPAVAEDRMATLEEAVPLVNQLVDAVNDLNNQVAALLDRISMLETQVGGRSVPMRQPIPRLGERGRRLPGGKYERDYDLPRGPSREDVRQTWPEYPDYPEPRPHAPMGAPLGPPPVRPSREPPPPPPGNPRGAQRTMPEPGERLPPAMEGPRPTFDRGSFTPHVPVGRVARGPGTPD